MLGGEVSKVKVIYSKLQIYTHTQNCTENKYVHAQGFYFSTITDNFSQNMFFLLVFSVVTVVVDKTKLFPTSGEMLHRSLLLLLTCL